MSPTSSTSGSNAAPAGTTATAAPHSAVSKDMFLKLLVAQIKNQDPLNPTDGVQFLSQLAQFTQLEQTIGMSTDLSAIRKSLDQLVPKQDDKT